MTIQVDFYLISGNDDLARYRFACLLIEKAYAKQCRLYAHCASLQGAHLLDELLWTFQEDSFIPHNLCGEGPTPPPAIQIGCSEAPPHHRDILLNLTSTIPTFHEKFRRIIEIIPEDPDAKIAARENYRDYRSKGYNLQSHKINP